MLITVSLSGHKLTLCNIYAPNNQANQLQFMQELNNCIIDKTELTSLIVGGDWNCTLSKKDKIGGAPWRPTVYSDLVSTTMEMFDLVHIQRVRHPKLRKFTYQSKSKIQNRLLSSCKKPHAKCYIVKTRRFIDPAIVPDHDEIFISLSLSNSAPCRDSRFKKLKNTLLND